MLRDRIQKQVYPGRSNTATILNYLEELVLIGAKEVGRVPISEDKGGYQDLLLDDDNIRSLTVPEEAVSASIQLEFACSDDEGQGSLTSSGINKSKPSSDCIYPVRYKGNGSDPSENSGFSLVVGQLYESIGIENLRRFRIIRVNAQKAYYIRIQYFKTGQSL